MPTRRLRARRSDPRYRLRARALEVARAADSNTPLLCIQSGIDETFGRETHASHRQPGDVAITPVVAPLRANVDRPLDEHERTARGRSWIAFAIDLAEPIHASVRGRRLARRQCARKECERGNEKAKRSCVEASHDASSAPPVSGERQGSCRLNFM